MLLTYFRMHITSLRCAIRATGGNRPQDYYMYKAGRYIRKDQPTITSPSESGWGAGPGAIAPQILADQFSLSQSGGQIMPTTLLHTPPL